jgi:hypothetical protein
MQQVILGIGNAVKWVMGVLLIVSFLNVMPNVVMPSVEVPTYSITSVKKFYSSDPPIESTFTSQPASSVHLKVE